MAIIKRTKVEECKEAFMLFDSKENSRKKMYFVRTFFYNLQQEWQLSIEQVAEYKEVFMLFDKDEDGVLSFPELTVVMKSLGQRPSGKHISRIFLCMYVFYFFTKKKKYCKNFFYDLLFPKLQNDVNRYLVLILSSYDVILQYIYTVL